MIRFGHAWVCAACKPVFVQKLKEGVGVAGAMEYVGFWIRFGAKFVDGIVLFVINMSVGFAVGLMAGLVASPDSSVAVAVPMIMSVFQLFIAAAYTTWFVGKYGATPGKMACKIKVVTADGDRVSYARALGRHFSEMLSAMILLMGYVMAAFDDEKRTLHDRICNTRVVMK
jgi:uncharacterized RDD family membrane protein YckC